MTPSPSTKERIQLIDILRGLTLLGIILVHFTEQYYAGMPPQKATHLNSAFLPDQIIQGLISFFIAGKFFMIFSFLFGLSFFIQSSAHESRRKFYIRFFWRLLILFAIGWIHHLHYRGDILTIYALLGALLLLLHTLPDRVILILAIVLIADFPSFVTRGVDAFTTKQKANSKDNPFGGNDADNVAYYDTLKGSSYVNILHANIPEFMKKMDFQVISGRIYITLGLFLLGLYIGRKKIFENIPVHLASIRKWRNKSLWGMLGILLFGVAFFSTIEFVLRIKLSFPAQFMVGGLLVDLLNACLAMFYVCIVILLYQNENWKQRLSYFYQAGRMGLTTYLMQTLFGFVIFFGIGFNLLDKVGASICFLLALAVFAVQIAFADWWLSRFYYGPVEWLWRSFTYLKTQPFKS